MYGFTYGSDVGENIFSVHIEKADRTVTGAYPALASALCKTLPERFTQINREEDLGIPGLRKAKEDWAPSTMIRKTLRGRLRIVFQERADSVPIIIKNQL